MKITVSVIKADVGGIGGHTLPSDGLLNAIRKTVKDAGDLLIDHYIGYCGDDSHIVMTHTKGIDNKEIHQLAWNAFMAGTKVAKEEGLYGAGQDLLKDSFSGNIKGMGPGVAEMEFDERPNEVFTVFAADKTEPGAFNYPIYKLFVDALSNTGLIVNQSLAKGVNINIMDVEKGKIANLSLWEDKPIIEAALMYPGRYVVDSVRTKDGEPILDASTDRLHNIAGTYVGKDDPVGLIRAQHGLPAVGEILEAFAYPHLVAGWMRGSHNGPLMPCKMTQIIPEKKIAIGPKATRFDGPPRVIALGFQLHDGYLEGPVDLFDDPAFEYTRMIAQFVTDYIRRMGPIMPHRLPPEEMEYTTLPKVLASLKYIPQEEYEKDRMKYLKGEA